MNDDKLMHLEPALEAALNALQSVPRRNASAAARGRAAFLAEAQAMRAVAPSTKNLARLTNRPRRLLRWVMAAAAAAVLGSAGVVYAAQGSLPDQPLYPVKLWSEDARLTASSGPNERLRLLIEFSRRRVVEMNAVRDRADTLRATETRLNAQMTEAARVAQSIGDLNDDARQSFEQLQSTLTPAPTFTPIPSPTVAPSATATTRSTTAPTLAPTLAPTNTPSPARTATPVPQPQPAQSTLPTPTPQPSVSTLIPPTRRPPGQTVRETAQAIRTALPPKPEVRETAQAIRTALPPKPEERETAQAIRATAQVVATEIAIHLPEVPKPPEQPKPKRTGRP